MKTKLLVCAVAAAAFLSLVARAEVPGRHPAFLRALTDLHDAHWNLEHHAGDPAARANEDMALNEIDRAINEIRQAAAEDGKNLNVHPREDAGVDRAGRLHHALDLLRRARTDASGEEDNPQTRDLRHRALEHIDAAVRFTERSIHDLEHHL